MEKLRVIFMGSPEIALPSIEAVSSSEEIVAVFSQPDRPSGRGKILRPPPVAAFAKERKLPLFQPEDLKGDDTYQAIVDLKPDVIVVVAYGRFIPKRMLDIPPKGCVNVHFSLLPKYRGAAPLQWAILNNEKETGVTTFYLVEKMDAGPIIMQEAAEIYEEDTGESLGGRLSEVGARLLKETLKAIKSGDAEAVPQDDEKATFAPILKKEDGIIDWKKSAAEIARKVRAFNPWPSAFTYIDKKLLKIYIGQVVNPSRSGTPGEILTAAGEILEVACGDGALRLLDLQIEGRKRMSAGRFLNGFKMVPGSVFSVPGSILEMG